MTTALLKDDGTVAEVRDALIIFVNIGVNLRTHSLSRKVGMGASEHD